MNHHTVLYVEDEENDVFFMRTAWKKAGVENLLNVVTDGEQALEYLSSQGEFSDRNKYPMPALLLLDLKLPKVSGLEVLKWIREQPGFHTLPVIVFSSSNKPEDICTAYERHANAYLVKPAQAQELVKLVADLKSFWLNRVEVPPRAIPQNAVC